MSQPLSKENGLLVTRLDSYLVRIKKCKLLRTAHAQRGNSEEKCENSEKDNDGKIQMVKNEQFKNLKQERADYMKSIQIQNDKEVILVD